MDTNKKRSKIIPISQWYDMHKIVKKFEQRFSRKNQYFQQNCRIQIQLFIYQQQACRGSIMITFLK